MFTKIRNKIIKRSLVVGLGISIILSGSFYGLPKAYASSNTDYTLTFTGNESVDMGAVLSDGNYSSTPIEGFQLDIFNTNSDDDTVATIAKSFGYFSADTMQDLGTSGGSGAFYASEGEAGVSPSQGLGTPSILVIKSHDGSEFNFKSIYVADAMAATSSIIFQGYKDGVCIITSESITVEQSGSILTPGSGFGAVDEVRISPSNGINYAYYNDITIGTTELSNTSTSGVTATGATLNFTSDEAGTYYYVVYAANDTEPYATAVKAQGTAVAKGYASALAAANTASVSGL